MSPSGAKFSFVGEAKDRTVPELKGDGFKEKDSVLPIRANSSATAVIAVIASAGDVIRIVGIYLSDHCGICLLV